MIGNDQLVARLQIFDLDPLHLNVVPRPCTELTLARNLDQQFVVVGSANLIPSISLDLEDFFVASLPEASGLILFAVDHRLERRVNQFVHLSRPFARLDPSVAGDTRIRDDLIVTGDPCLNERFGQLQRLDFQLVLVGLGKVAVQQLFDAFGVPGQAIDVDQTRLAGLVKVRGFGQRLEDSASVLP